MRINMDEATRSRVKPTREPSVAPFSARHALQTKSRSILVHAAACFFATALGSLSPMALDLFDGTLTTSVAANVDPESGKFTDRILIGGLHPISWDEDAKVAPAPAFTMVPILSDNAEPSRARVALVSARSLKEPGVRRIDRGPEAKSLETTAAPIVASEPAPEPKAEKIEERGALAALTPSVLSAKVLSAKVSEKAWAGVKSVGGAVTSGLSWLGY
ncbi:hypothetical protein [Methylocystis parvus]|uniref:Uncharacterized protein n=1 Tax=Methylocystis parvus TaxID=134 RepID=A0A6B8M8E6_9HYPH|nr:hypothetical protein [Methylocystis parvus]QGM98856.1 hypothetical protein F7D14_16120 [Methylocystis parvus]WBK00791.1 hypothetical protein MMG94_03425 [Methylocystis parvus OBBP]